MLPKTKRQIVTTVVAVFIISSMFTIPRTQAQIEGEIHDASSLNYVNSGAIAIDEDLDFFDLGLPGNGTVSNPYIIENLKVRTDAQKGISIKDTTSYFVIKDCNIDSYEFGIYIESVAEGTGTIHNNTCLGIRGGIGIVLLYSEGLTVTDNIFYNNYQGANIASCPNLNFTNNYIGFNNVPYEMEYCPNSFIFNNSIAYGQYTGMDIFGCNNTIISNNTLFDVGSSYYWGSSAALEIGYASNMTIAYNRIDESREGISIGSIIESEFIGNVIIGSERYGVILDYYGYGFPTANNTLHHNYFIDNANYDSWRYSPDSQAYDYADNSTWYDVNTNVGNYWSNYTGVGTYPIDGHGLSFDPYPITVQDSDNDNLDDIIETYITFTDVYNNDTDGELLLDGEEYWIYFTDPLSNDTDFDDLTDYEECYIYNTNPLLRDTDYDMITDGEEILIYFTSPRDWDTDDDEIPDGWEALNGIDPLTSSAQDDPDNDGLTNFKEYEEESLPLNPDTDGDLLDDGTEVFVCQSSPLNNDTDGDGVIDGVEYHDYGCDPTDTDSDNDNLSDGKEILIYFTDPTVVDSDGDLCGDGWEVQYKLDPLDSSDGDNDPDYDRLTNTEEYLHGTSPKNWDSDEDGFSDGIEVRKGTDPLLITDHPMARDQVIKMSIGISIGAAAVLGIVFYILVKKKIIRLKK